MPRQDQRGSTLLEVILAIFLVGLIATALGEALVVSFTQRLRTDEQLSGSLDRERLSTYFPPDVASADVVQRDTSSCATPNALVSFGWTDRGVEKAASYVLEGEGVGRKLVRRYCEGGALKGSEQVMSDSVAAVDDAVVVTCAPDPACTGSRTVEIAVRDRGNLTAALLPDEATRRTRYTVTAARRAAP